VNILRCRQGQILIDACEADHGGVKYQKSRILEWYPPAELKSLFDRYYMIDKDQQGVQGSGLGLAIVQAHSRNPWKRNQDSFKIRKSYTSFESLIWLLIELF